MTSDTSPPARKRTPRLVTVLTAVVLVLLLGGRLLDVAEQLGQTRSNRAALHLAMDAHDGRPAAPGTLARPDPAAAVSGVAARAQASAAATAERPADAEAWLLAGMTDSSSAYLTQFQLCHLYWTLSETDRALQVCRGSVASVNYWLGAGYRALDANQPEEALALFELAAFTDPGRAEAWRRYGRSLLDAGRPQEAVVALERVLFLVLVPEPDVYYTLAQAYLRLENLTMARDVLDEGIRHYPDEREYYRTMAESFLAEGDRQSADAWYVRLLQRWPFESGVWAARAKLAQEDGRMADALNYYHQAANNSPNGFGHWMSLAAAAAEAGDAALVAEATTQAMSLRPEDAGAWLQTGRYLTQTGQPEAARVAFERVLALQPDNLEAAAELSAITDALLP